jgi:hypothetical protein
MLNLFKFATRFVLSRIFPHSSQELESQLILSHNTISKLLTEVEVLKRHSSNVSQSNSRINSQSRNVTTLESLNIIIPPISPLQCHKLRGTTSGHQSSHAQRHDSTRKGDGRSNHDPGIVSRTVNSIEEQLTELRHMFDGTNPIDQRSQAALKIQTAFRSHSVQKKYYAYKKSFQSWRVGRSVTFLPYLEHGLLRAGRVEMILNTLSIRREYHFTLAIFSRWKHICQQSAPFRFSMRTAAEEKYLQVIFRLKAQVISSLF